MLLSNFSSPLSATRSSTAAVYFAATAAASSLAALAGLAAGVVDGAGAAGLSTPVSVLTGAAPAQSNQHQR